MSRCFRAGAPSASPSNVASANAHCSPCPQRPSVPSFEPLTFEKVPVTKGPQSTSGGSVLSPWTDSECVVSDSGDPDDTLSRSPSLLTSLIRCQSRRSARTTPTTTPGVSPSASPVPLPRTKSPYSSLPRGCQPTILRRCSSGAASNATDSGSLALSTKAATAGAAKILPPSLQHRRSCLKFAVTPRPLQLQPATTSAASSRRASFPAMSPRSDEDDEEEDEVATPAFQSDDAGYQEDFEDGFTTDEEAGTEVTFVAPQWPRRWCVAQGNLPAPILSRPRVSGAAPDVTTDDGADADAALLRTPLRRSRIRIRDDGESAQKCTRHRSPPPVSRLVLSESRKPAPPAARSPSAADLCRRRSGIGNATPRRQSPAPTAASVLVMSRGWRSDDNVRSRARVAAAPSSFVPQRSTSERVSRCDNGLGTDLRCTNVKFDVVDEPGRKNTCVLSVRRDSAPARVAEVNVLANSASTSQQSCSGKLKSSLRM